jgi:serine/threonine protein kinase/Tol biopolymer transport system component
MDLVPDSVLHDRYRIQRLLGSGGMGAVYLAFDQALDHLVAVKVNQATSPEATAQFKIEARLLATLRHPNLPRVSDYFIEDENQFLVMDYIPGDDLKSRIAQYGPVPFDQVLRLAQQLGSALSYLHRQDPPIFHRDVKPANLKLSPEGEIILVDFGIAKAAPADQQTAAGAAMDLTPGYAPPEQYGRGLTGVYTDQFSLAATLYNLFTAVAPADALQRLLGEAHLTPLAQLDPTIPPHVAATIERALSLRPEERFASVDEFLHALSDPAFQPVPPPPSSIPAQPPEPVVTLPGLPAQQVVVAPPLPPPSQPVFVGPPPQSTPPPPVAASPASVDLPPLPPPPPEYAFPPDSNYPAKRPVWPFILGGALVIALVVGAVLLFSQMKNQNQPVPMANVSPSAATLLATSPAPATRPPSSPSPRPQSTNTRVPPTNTLLPSATLTPTLAPTETPTFTPTLTSTPTLVPFAKSGGLAFASDRPGGKDRQIWLANLSLDADGKPVVTGYIQLTTDPGDKSQPAWSPDGTKLLYVAPGGGANGLDIFLLDLSASSAQPINLTHRLGDDTDPSWSPDGKWIALTNNGRSDKVPMIDIMQPDGSGLRRVTVDLQETNPTWSPDVKWLAYVMSANGLNILYLRDVTTDYAATQPFDLKTFIDRTGQVSDPAWAPTADLIAYTRLDGQTQTIYIMPAASRANIITKLTTSGKDHSPAWSPDSGWIAFTSERDGNSEVYIMDSAGHLQTNISASPGVDTDPAFRP